MLSGHLNVDFSNTSYTEILTWSPSPSPSPTLVKLVEMSLGQEVPCTLEEVPIVPRLDETPQTSLVRKTVSKNSGRKPR